MIVFENRFFRMGISEKNALVSFFAEKPSGKSHLDKNADLSFCYLYKTKTERIHPKRAEWKDPVLTVFFEHTSVSFSVDVREEFVLFECLTALSGEYTGLAFVNIPLKRKASGKNAGFAAVGLAMTAWTDPCFYPTANNPGVRAECITELGTMGAGYALIAAPLPLHREIIKAVCSLMDREKVAVSKAGGVYSQEYKGNSGDYVIIYEASPEKAKEWSRFYASCGVDQLDFHKGANTFRQGDFRFETTKNACDFRKKISDPLREGNIVSGLHTYSFYTACDEDTMLCRPEYQQDLEITETYTLRDGIDAEQTALPIEEDMALVPTLTGYRARSSHIVLLDQEMIAVDFGKDGFINCTRGSNGTKAVPHKKGTKIRRIGSYYGGLAPVPGSRLFYQIARNTAQAYNEGGFGMIYFDALNSITLHTEYGNYYAAMFVHECLKHCKTDPIVEYATMYPTLWISRGRIGAWDHPNRGYKAFNRLHIEANKPFLDSYNTITLGWYLFFNPDEKHPGNFHVKYQFSDDLDYLGTLAVAYDCSIVYNGLTKDVLSRYPAYARNIEYYKLYNDLRKANYFPEQIKKQLRRDTRSEFKLVRVRGKYCFARMSYVKEKGTLGEWLPGINPYGAQRPFLRIEGMGSSAGENPLTLIRLDPSKPLSEQNGSAVFKDELDLSDRLALKVRVRGTGKADAVCIRLTAGYTSEQAVADYCIGLNYEGEREFILAETDNGEFGQYRFSSKKDPLYPYFRGILHYDRVNGITVYQSDGSGAVYLSDITAVRRTDNPIENPAVTIGSQTITFRCVLGSSEYLEYDGTGKYATVFDRYGNQRRVFAEGSLPTVPGGAFRARIGGEARGNGPGRARLTLGFQGKTVK